MKKYLCLILLCLSFSAFAGVGNDLTVYYDKQNPQQVEEVSHLFKSDIQVVLKQYDIDLDLQPSSGKEHITYMLEASKKPDFTPSLSFWVNKYQANEKLILMITDLEELVQKVNNG